jgi:hypothetical protein
MNQGQKSELRDHRKGCQMRSTIGCSTFTVLRLGTVAAGLWLAAFAPAMAATIANRDEKEHKITLVEGEKTATHVLKPQTARTTSTS